LDAQIKRIYGIIGERGAVTASGGTTGATSAGQWGWLVAIWAAKGGRELRLALLLLLA